MVIYFPHFIILSVVIVRIFSFIFFVYVRLNYHYTDESLSETTVESKNKNDLKFYF